MEISHDSIEAQGFTGRKEALRRIKRWASFGPAFYRHDLEMHSLELRFLMEELSPLIRETLPSFNFERALVLAMVHDDPETVSTRGDVPFNIKLNMSEAELVALDEEEERAIGLLREKWPSTVNGYSYIDLLHESKGKKTPESQLESYLDKYSALCESLHELFAGNLGFHKGWQTPRNRPPVAGTNIAELTEKYTLIRPFFCAKHSVIAPYQKPDPRKSLEDGKLYTSDSILVPTGFKHYDFWKFTILKRGGEEGLKWLIEQREFD